MCWPTSMSILRRNCPATAACYKSVQGLDQMPAVIAGFVHFLADFVPFEKILAPFRGSSNLFGLFVGYACIHPHARLVGSQDNRPAVVHVDHAAGGLIGGDD